MRTIDRHFPTSNPDWDYESKCDYCGTHWYRSDLRLDRSGNLVCPDHDHGRDVATLDQDVATSGTDRQFIRRDTDEI